MDVLHSRCCGLDVHKSSISACILVQEAGRVQKHQRRFGAMTQNLQELANWLRQFEVTQVAMESSGHNCRLVRKRCGVCRMLSNSAARIGQSHV
jgi:hypothetical protein